MSYTHIIRAVLGTCWAIHEDWLRAIIEVVNRRATAGKLSPEEIQAAIDGQEIHAAIDGRKMRSVAQQDGDVMVLPLYGVISNRAYMVQDVSGPRGASAEIFSRLFNAALNDDNIKAIVIDVNSPGGTVNGVEELSSEIFNARGKKPIIAQVNAYAASAAYWIASAADEIVVTPSGEVGSIGVWSMHQDVSEKVKMDGIKPTLISAGKFKVEGNPFEPLNDDARAAIQSDIDAFYDMFVSAVARNRGVSAQAVREGFGEGRMVRAQQAVKEGMADRIGTMSETLQRLGVGSSPSEKQKRGAAGLTSNIRARDRELELLSLKQ